MSETVLKKEEQVAFALRSLYRKYGYLPYKMSKFEAYDLYVANKDFLLSDGVITFNDTDGKLLALKPDVTLSIIKNSAADEKLKVYYNENVYRISGETKQFKELMQVGVERIGDVGAYDVYETVYLAAASLAHVSDAFVLDISHLGIVAGVLEEINGKEKFNQSVMRLIAEKNAHETAALCKQYSVSEEGTKKLLTIVNAYGDIQTVLKTLAPICEGGKAAKAYIELKTLCALLQASEYASHIRLDFSVVNDMQYYNGIVMKGFVDGVCEGILSGGQYDRLMARMGKNCGAIGFAVYLDLLEGFHAEKSGFDVDTVVLYDKNTDVQAVFKAVQKRVEKGELVSALSSVGKLRAREIVDLRTGGNK